MSKKSSNKSGSKRTSAFSSKLRNKPKPKINPKPNSKPNSKANPLDEIESDENNFESKKNDIIKTIKEINTLTKKVLMDLKELETIHKKELKTAGKNTNKKSGKKSGFNKPVPVPVPLQKLLKLDNQPLARSNVTKLMYKYIRENNLYSPETKKIIIPNKEMRTIFGIKKNNVMEFENFQTWLKKLYNEGDELVLDIND
jgi:chromatin remodeling complex protein RSC6